MKVRIWKMRKKAYREVLKLFVCLLNKKSLQKIQNVLIVEKRLRHGFYGVVLIDNKFHIYIIIDC